MFTLSLQQTDVIRVLQSRNTRRFVWLLNVLLVVWIASLVANLTRDLLAPSEPQEPEAGVTTPVPAAPPSPDRQLISQLPGWHLMGVVAKGSAPPVQVSVPVDAPETKLKLVLRGVFSSDDKSNGHAIIADPRGNEEQYTVGDMLPGDAELSEVHADKVILQRGGRFETLRLPEDENLGNTAARPNTSVSRTAFSRSSSSPSERLREVRENMRKRPRDLYNLVRATPKKGGDGNIIGFELGPGRDPDLFRQVGLQEGDVAIQINDIKLDNPANSARALKSAQSGETVSVTVLRNGQEEVLSLSVPE
jgi:general secretion pathway protein C